MTEGFRIRLSPTSIKEFFLCFVSIEMLLLSNLFGTLAIVGFILPWVWFVITRPRLIWQSLVINWPLLLFPALALLSTLWSIEPMWTLRASLEFTTTFTIGIMAAQRIQPRTLISAILIVLLLIAALCVLSGNYNMIGMSGEEALQGIFGSKNAFSAVMSLLLLTSLSVFIDRHYGGFFTMAALAGILIAPVMLYLGRSLDSIVASFLTIMIFFAVKLLRQMPKSIWLLVPIFIIGIMILVAYTIILSDFNPMNMLNIVGKDSSLTGRTYLWSRAWDFIQERPLFGDGYQAFWRITNPRAQELWLYGKVPIGSGFGFHNEYLQILVDEGATGLMLLLCYIFIISKRAGSAILTGLRSEQNFAFMIFTYLLLRTPLETALFAQFNIGTMLVCIIWIYFKPSSPWQSNASTTRNKIVEHDSPPG